MDVAFGEALSDAADVNSLLADTLAPGSSCITMDDSRVASIVTPTYTPESDAPIVTSIGSAPPYTSGALDDNTAIIVGCVNEVVNIDDVTKSGHGHLTAFEFVVASVSPESADNDSKCGNADTLLSNPGDDHWVGDWNDPAIPPGLIHDDSPSDSSSRGPSPEYPEPTTPPSEQEGASWDTEYIDHDGVLREKTCAPPLPALPALPALPRWSDDEDEDDMWEEAFLITSAYLQNHATLDNLSQANSTVHPITEGVHEDLSTS
jgi:hypothetical protein